MACVLGVGQEPPLDNDLSDDDVGKEFEKFGSCVRDLHPFCHYSFVDIIKAECVEAYPN